MNTIVIFTTDNGAEVSIKKKLISPKPRPG
jgi:arylsulfatase A-like enzyme